MKKMKKLASLLLAAIMVLAMAVPAMATESTATAASTTHAIKIKETVPGHVFNAYQIFKGDVATSASGKEIFSNVQWGEGITEAGQDALLGAFGVEKTSSEYHPLEKLMEAMHEAKDGKDAKWLATFLETGAGGVSYLKDIAGTASIVTGEGNNAGYEINNLASGYYMVVDMVDGNTMFSDNVYSSYIVEVLSDDVTSVAPKSEKPSVDKEVWDDEDEAWQESADHDINQNFQFRLTAILPKNENFNFYEQYEMVFHDTMSKGITFKSIESVKVYSLAEDGESAGTQIGENLSEGNKGYTVSTGSVDAVDPPAGYEEGSTLTVTIPNLMDNIGAGHNLGDGYFVEVIYNAILNEKAIVAPPQGEGAAAYTDMANLNKVNLEYSNNPNVNGEGKTTTTPDDTVYVFTYELPSTKYQNSIDDDNTLAGAGFTLYDETGTIAFALIKNNDGTYTVADQSKLGDAVSGNAAKEAEANTIVTEMFSAKENGKFVVKGLDNGTYVLKETTTPPGFNTCDDITVVVKGEHKEIKEAESSVSVKMTTSQNKETPKQVIDNAVINNSGTTLPETGGIGTTIFYVLGTILVVGAVILLVTKKRMSVEK